MRDLPKIKHVMLDLLEVKQVCVLDLPDVKQVCLLVLHEVKQVFRA